MQAFEQYEAGSSGGGCLAYFRNVGNVQVMLTCSEDESRLPAPGDKVDLGFYDRETGEPLGGEEGESFLELTLAEAEACVQAFIAYAGAPATKA